MKYRLKAAIIKIISDDGELYGKVAKAYGITGPSLAATLRRNTEALTQKRVLEIISSYTGIAEEDLYDIIPEPAEA